MKFRDHDLTLYAAGEIVAVKWTDGKWYRARVVDHNPHTDKLQVGSSLIL